MELDLTGKVSVITGGGVGIGKATAVELAKEGCKITLCGRRKDVLETGKKQIEKLGVEVFVQSVDVTDAAAVKDFAGAVYRHFGRLDIWINNAGDNETQRVWEVTEEKWNHQVDVNFKSVFFASQIAAHYMAKEKRGGVIINVSSYSSIIPNAPRAVYSAAKTAVNSLSRSFAGEYAKYNIRVNTVIPGPTITELGMKVRKPDSVLPDVAMRRQARPEEVAKPIVFLCSDAAGFITGTSLEVSGGKFCVQQPAESWDFDLPGIE